MAEGSATAFVRKLVAKAEPYVPQVPKPKKKLTLQNRLMWCGGILHGFSYNYNVCDKFSGCLKYSSFFRGIVPFFVESAMAGDLADVLFRYNQLPSIFGLLLTAGIMLILVYTQGMKIEIPIVSTKYRGFSAVYPIMCN